MSVWKTFKGWFVKSSPKLENKPKEPNRGASWAGSYGGKNPFPPREALDAYGEHAYLYAAIQRISEDLAALPLKLLKGKGKDAKEIVEHPILDLLQQPSTEMDGFLFRQQIAMDLLLSGNCYVLLLGSNRIPSSLARLHPVETSFVTDKKKGIVGVKNVSSGSTVSYPIDRVLFSRLASYALGPKQLYGTGVVQPLFEELRSDYNSMMLVSEASAKGRPDVLISPSDEADVWPKEVREEIVDNYKKMAKSGGAIALSGMAKIDLLNLKPREMEYKEARTMARESISAVCGISPSVLGMPASNYATALEQRTSYWQNQKMKAKRLEVIYNQLAKLWDSQFSVVHVFNEIEALSSRDQQLQRIQLHIMNGMSPQMAYQYEGLGDAPIGKSAKPDEPVEVVVDEEERQILLNFIEKSEEQRAMKWKAWINTKQAPTERRFKRAAKAYLSRSKKAIIKNFDRLKKKSIATANGTEELYLLKNINLFSELIQPQEQEEIIADTLSVVYEKTFSDNQQRELIDIFDQARREMNLQTPLNDELVGIYIDDLAKKITNTTKKHVERIVNEGMAQGLPVSQIRRNIENEKMLFDEERAILIARTEATKCLNTSKVSAMQTAMANGIELQKEWLSERDGDVRIAHQLLDSQRVGVNESFVVPPGSDYSGAQTESPGSFGEAGLDCNCRCTVVSILNVEE
tara:strand:- start:10842 stop:12908 length:2067 start_codon:yes stop_codon:yes gene_type:complete